MHVYHIPCLPVEIKGCAMQKLTPQIERSLHFWHLEWQMSSQAVGRNHGHQKPPERWWNADCWLNLSLRKSVNTKDFYLHRLWTNVLCLKELSQTGCRRETASHWCDQPHWEGCYGSLWMESLRTNGVCFPGAGMGKRALIECTGKGIFLNNGRIVHFVRGRAVIQYFAVTGALQPPPPPPVSPPCTQAALLPVRLSIPAIPVQHVAPVGSARMPGQQAGAARGSVPPALPVITGSVCARVRCWLLHCALRPIPHCNKFNLTAGTGWNATTTPDPLPPSELNHYTTQLFRFGPSDTLGSCAVDCQEAARFPPIFLVSPVAVSASPPLTKPFPFTPVHFSNWHRTLREHC